MISILLFIFLLKIIYAVVLRIEMLLSNKSFKRYCLQSCNYVVNLNQKLIERCDFKDVFKVISISDGNELLVAEVVVRQTNANSKRKTEIHTQFRQTIFKLRARHYLYVRVGT